MKSCREKAVQALLQGHGCANQLKLWLDDPKAEQGSVPSEDLAKTILDCFSDALSVLIDDTTCVDPSFEFSPNMSSLPLPSQKHQRNPPKRRKTTNMEASGDNWRDDSPAPIYYDGFLWRKYGQKTIKRTEYQRSYYRCAYTTEHQCDAKKHVQKIQDNPPVFRTTYFGHHTCRINQDSAFPVVFNPSDDFGGAQMIRFGEINQESNRSDFTSAVGPQEIVKEEAAEEQIINRDQDQYMTKDSWSPSDFYPPSFLVDGPDLMDDLDYFSFDQFDFGLC